MNESQANQARARFQQITAAYRCTRCGHVVERRGGSSSVFHAFIALVAALPPIIILLRPPWSQPWHSVFGIVAGEFLLVYAAGIPLSIFFIGTEPRVCSHCRAPMMLSGRYFSDSQRPQPVDFVHLALFVVLNLTLIIYIWPSRFFQ